MIIMLIDTQKFLRYVKIQDSYDAMVVWRWIERYTNYVNKQSEGDIRRWNDEGNKDTNNRRRGRYSI
mgnify:CR=1 FL=1